MKFGGKWDEENRHNRTDSDMDNWSYIGPGGNTAVFNPTIGAWQNTAYGNWANVGPHFIAPIPFDGGTTNAFHIIGLNGQEKTPPRVSRSEVANLFHSRPELFVNTSTPENFYTDQYVNLRRFKQTIYAGYWQADTRITPRITIRYGVRAEQTQNAFKEFDPLTRSQLLALGVPLNPTNVSSGRPLTTEGMRTMFEKNPVIIRRAQYTEWFPSIVTKYQITPNLEWQFGANKGILRPGVNDLTGTWTLNDNANPPTVTTSNAGLEPERLKVFQTRLAYYFHGKSPGQISVQLNRVETTNFIQSRTFTAAEFGVNDPDFESYNFITRFNTPGLNR
ncbi:MAG: TonB-dependent receptor, partial [Phycisphaerales bacterium]|nr:TonB-dependent receptor [Phycisphaerales bacterium]